MLITFYDLDEINEKYSVHFNRIFYSNLTNCMANLFASKGIFTYKDIDMPIYPSIIKFTRKQKKGCSFYSKLLKYDKLKKDGIIARHNKWITHMNIQQNTIDFYRLYKFNMKITFDNRLRFFHLQLIRLGLTTKRQTRHFVDNHLDNLCTFCSSEPETIIHLLFECNVSQTFIGEVKNNISVFYNYDESFLLNPLAFLTGALLRSPNDRTFILILNMSRFLYISKCKEELPSFAGFKNFFNHFLINHK